MQSGKRHYISYERNTSPSFLHAIHTPSWRYAYAPLKVKRKCVRVLLTEHYAMKVYWGVEV